MNMSQKCYRPECDNQKAEDSSFCSEDCKTLMYGPANMVKMSVDRKIALGIATLKRHQQEAMERRRNVHKAQRPEEMAFFE